jgi:protein TonB
LQLPFEINPRLPSGPSALVLPALEMGAALGSMPDGLGDAFNAGQLDAPLIVLMPNPAPLSHQGQEQRRRRVG